MQTLFNRIVSLTAAGFASAALTALVVAPFISIAGTPAGLIA